MAMAPPGGRHQTTTLNNSDDDSMISVGGVTPAAVGDSEESDDDLADARSDEDEDDDVPPKATKKTQHSHQVGNGLKKKKRELEESVRSSRTADFKSITSAPPIVHHNLSNAVLSSPTTNTQDSYYTQTAPAPLQLA